MIVEKKNIKKIEFSLKGIIKYILQLYFAICITTCIIYSVDSKIIVVLIATYTIYSMYLVNFNPFNPIVWLLPFIYLYHFSIILLDIFNVRSVIYESNLLIIGWVAIFVTSFLLSIGSQRNLSFNFTKTNIDVKNISLNIMFISLTVLVLFHNMLFIVLGISSKSEASLSGFNILQFVHLWFLTIYSVILVKKYLIENTPSFKFVVTIFLISLFTTLNLGQRDVLLTYLIITILVLFLYYRPQKYVIFLFGLLVLAFIPILGETKNLFSRNEINISLDNLFIDLLSGEFLSAGRNLETLLKYTDQWEYFYGQTFLWDLTRSFVPGIIYYTQNSVGWFNNTFHLSRVLDGYGLGFALSGEGLINFGMIGVFICYLILSVLLINLINISKRNIIVFIIYINSIPFFIYVLRADFSNLISPILKSVLLPLIILFILNEIFKKYVYMNRQ